MTRAELREAPSASSSGTAAGAQLLSVDGLQVQFATAEGWTTVVDDVSFSVDAGETVGLVGESGSGKTVTGLAVMGLVPTPPGRVAGGAVHFRGMDLTSLPERRLRELRGDELAMVFQEPMTSLNPAYTIGDQIAETVRRHRRWPRRRAWGRAKEVLGLVGIPDAPRRARAYPHEFSGGMRQRAMIAMALCCEPKLLIADEPTTALDVTIQAQVLDLLRHLRTELGMAMVFVTHDLGVVAEICDRVVVMYAGQMVETGTAAQLFTRPEHPYTEGLLSSMPQLGPRSGRLASIAGVAPEPGSAPEGCRFHPRCPHAQDRCLEGPVPMIALSDLGRQSRCVRVDELHLRGTQ